jgi:hypothetical protein
MNAITIPTQANLQLSPLESKPAIINTGRNRLRYTTEFCAETSTCLHGELSSKKTNYSVTK